MTGKDNEDTFFCGVDVGSSTTKVVLLDGEKKIGAYRIRKSGVDFSGVSRTTFEETLREAGISIEGVRRTIATGLGRENVAFAHDRRTEIGCHGTGCYHYFPEAITVVDIGGQDNKIIRMNDRGERTHFKMNRKCAAGTGAFLEEIANKMDIPIGDLDGLARRAREEVVLGSFCTVFTQTEILGKIRQGATVEGIIKGAYRSVIKRILEMDPLQGTVVATGGVVAHNPIIVEMLREQLGNPVRVPPLPQLTGAVGAALAAMEE